MPIPTVYLAGAMAGKTDAECKAWRERATEILKQTHDVLNPMKRDFRGVDMTREQCVQLCDDDKADIDRADAVIVKADDGASWGTAMEVIYAHSRGKAVVAFIGDSRVSPWVIGHATEVCKTLEEACNYVKVVKTTLRYVVGFYFRPGFDTVALIEKQRPEWQKNKFNGIGGKVEDHEHPADAMRREFKEETGADVTTWRQFNVMRFRGMEVYFFTAVGDTEVLTGSRSPTDELVAWVQTSTLWNLPIVNNLRWLIPLAADRDKVSSLTEDPS